MQNYFQENNKFSETLSDEIQALCKDFILISEIDVPVLAFTGMQADDESGDVCRAARSARGKSPR